MNNSKIQTKNIHPFLYALIAFFVVSMVHSMYVHLYGVNIPFWDEWDGLVLGISKYHAGILHWQELFNQHLDHRIFVVRVAAIFLYTVFGDVNLVSFMLLSAFLNGLIAFILTYTFRKLQFTLWPCILVCFILASPMQSENILWGFQTCFFFLILFSFLPIFIIASRDTIGWATLLSISLCCLLATYSMVSGIFSWFVTGFCLVLWMTRDGFRTIFTNKVYLYKILFFSSVGGMSIALYFVNYAFFAVGRSEDLVVMILWSVTALIYPTILPVDNIYNYTMLIVFLFFWLPIVLIIIYYIKNTSWINYKKLILFAGISLFLIINVFITSYGRSHSIFIPSRYATVFLWSGILHIFAVSELLKISKTLSQKRRLYVAPILSLVVTVMLCIQGWRYITGIGLMQVHHDEYVSYEEIVERYVNSPVSHRILGEPAPFPEDRLPSLLNDANYISVLPSALRPLNKTIDGDAWTIGGVFPTIQTPKLMWGSWSGSDRNTGTFVSNDIYVSAPTFSLIVSGYPASKGNLLRIEDINNPAQKVTYTGANPGQHWKIWNVDMSKFSDKHIRIVAIDGIKTSEGWFGFSINNYPSLAGYVMEYFMSHIVQIFWIGCIVIICSSLTFYYTRASN